MLKWQNYGTILYWMNIRSSYKSYMWSNLISSLPKLSWNHSELILLNWFQNDPALTKIDFELSDSIK